MRPVDVSRIQTRGDGGIHVDLDAVAKMVASEAKDCALIALDDALEALSPVDERRARVVAMPTSAV